MNTLLNNTSQLETRAQGQPPVHGNWLADLVKVLPTTKIGVVGDFCLDVYWEQDLSAAERSLETGLMTRPVREQRYGLGGAGNIVNNLAAIGVGVVEVFGVVGDDPFGREMQRLLEVKRVGRSWLLTQPSDWNTFAYLKPIKEGREESRIDFGNFNRLHDMVATSLLEKLESVLPTLNIVIINQQVLRGVHTDFFRTKLNQLVARATEKTFIADCRDVARDYANCLHRINEVEAVRQCGVMRDYGDAVSLDEAQKAAQQLFANSGKPIFISRGERGVLVADAAGVHIVPGLHIINPTDPVGAGDSMLAGIAAALAAGCTPEHAAMFGNFVAGVTVQKLFQTGTASPAEILAIGTNPDYVYAPELADDTRQAIYDGDTEIEIVSPLPHPLRITHAIFDHDGTISTLRQGWEAVMEPMMIKAVLGNQYAAADETLYGRVVRRVREFIDKTTGIQTIAQMQGLVKIVREFGLLSVAEVRDEFQYKAIYLDALMNVVSERLTKLQRGELDLTDFTVKSAPQFLNRLRSAGVKLYLASGTDEKDVVFEAEALGYAELFEGRIYGAVQDVTVEAKRMVLERILKDIGTANVTQVVTFGDGPVEIRETRKRGGITVGIASDEVRRYGLSSTKRSRLICAGAHLVVADYSQQDQLLGRLDLL